MNSKYEFFSGRLPDQNQWSGITALYNSQEYLTAFRHLSFHSFYIRGTGSQEIMGSVQFQMIEDRAYSIFSAPFGSFTLSTDIDIDTLSAFIDFIEQELINKGTKELIIRHFPEYYGPQNSELIQCVLGLKGYRVKYIDIDQYLIVSRDAFQAGLHSMELRKLKKCKAAGFIFTEYPNTEAELVFKHIGSFRKAKGIPVNISDNIFEHLVQQFPEKYKFYAVQSNKDIIAATICVCVNSNVLYNFLPADDLAYRSYSPMVYLINNLYELARELKYRYLDLGVSSLNGNLQGGLARFKERLGARVSGKMTFSKKLH